MNIEGLIDLYRYNQWANRRVWTCVEALTDAQFDEALDYSIGAIHNQVAHVMGVEYWWIAYLAKGELNFVTGEDCERRENIRAKWDEANRTALAYLDALRPEDLLREVRPPFWRDQRPAITVLEALLHIVLHSQDHRAQILAGLHRLGAPTTEIDMLFYQWEKRGAPANQDF